MQGTPRQEQQPAEDAVIEVSPGIRRMQLDVQIPGLGHVNCYAMEDERGFAIMDPGMPGAEHFETLQAALRRAEIPMHRIHSVIVTHSHPDHFGGAMRVRHESGADIIAHQRFRTMFEPVESGDADPEQMSADGVSIEEVIARSPMGRKAPWGGNNYEPLDAADRQRMLDRIGDPMFHAKPTVRLEDADHLMLAKRRWVALHTPGHTSDHLCLFDPETGVLFSGDHVLPTITPHISGMHYGSDPLSEYFASLRRVARLPGVTQVLPAHGHPFHDLARRVDEIIEHHDERLDTLLKAAAEYERPASVAELMRRLFRERSWGSMAESETFAHLEHLRLLSKVDQSWDEDIAFYAVSESGQ